jgi:hypothetical protein
MAAVVALATILTGCMSPRQAQIYPHAESTSTSPVYVLLVSKGGITKKDVTFCPPLYEEYFKLAGRKTLYSTGEFTWSRSNTRKQPEGQIAVDWTNRNVTVDASGFHLYDGSYDDVAVSAELLIKENN